MKHEARLVVSLQPFRKLTISFVLGYASAYGSASFVACCIVFELLCPSMFDQRGFQLWFSSLEHDPFI